MKWLEELKENRGTIPPDVKIKGTTFRFNSKVSRAHWEAWQVDRLIAIAEGARVVYETGICGSCPICGIYLEHCDPPVDGVELEVEHHESCPYSDEWEGK